VRIVGASIRAIGGRAIELRGGTRNAVDSVTIEDVGGGGVLVSGGDRRTLDPSGHIIERTRITRFARWSRTLTHAIDVAGVGVTVRGCEFSYGPHTGVMFSGNDHLIENNVLHHLLLETEDAGAVYIGRDWTSRGNIIRGNYFYSLGPSQSILARSPLAAIYLDDMASGVAVTRNVFDHAQTAVLINGGRDNVIEDNIIVHSEPVLALYPGGRGFYAERDQPNSVWQQLLELYKRARPDTAPYLIRYSSLREMIDREPGEPLGNSFTQNVVIESEQSCLLDCPPKCSTFAGRCPSARQTRTYGLWRAHSASSTPCPLQVRVLRKQCPARCASPIPDAIALVEFPRLRQACAASWRAAFGDSRPVKNSLLSSRTSFRDQSGTIL
jgi:hypothetical protein